MQNPIFKYKWNSPERQTAALRAGISNYTGSAEQNASLENFLNTEKQAVVPAVTKPIALAPITPTPAPTLPNNDYSIGTNGLQISPEAYDAYVAQGEAEYSPYYDANERYTTADYESSNNSLQNSYNTAMTSFRNNLNNDLEDLNDKEGRSGTWASSARANRRKNLEEKYDTNYENAFNQTSDNLYKNRLDQAYKLGDSKVSNNNPFTKYNADLSSGNAQINENGFGGEYKPLNLYGTSNTSKKVNSKLYAENKVNTFNKLN